MKKVLITGILFALILLSFLVIAQDIGNEEEEETGIGELSSKIGKKTQEFFEQEINIPESLQILTRIIFGVKGEIALSELVVLLGVWLMLFLVIHSVLKLTPFFEGWKALLGAVIVTILIAVTGAIRSVAVFFFNLGNIFGIFEKWSPLKIIFALALIAFLVWAGRLVSKIIEKKTILGKAEIEGLKAGAGMRMAKEAFEQGAGI